MPKFDKSEAKGRKGIHEVGLAISRMKWIFRDQPVSDTGIDGHIETCDQNERATGKLIGCQIKSGPSYFGERTASGFVYRGDADHLAYWLGHSLPVIVVLCKEETAECFWQVINEDTVVRTGKEWKIEVPKSQILREGEKTALQTIADTGWIEPTFTTSAKFFRRTEPNSLFDYEQTLYGRVSSLAELNQFLQVDHYAVAVLTGRVGIGKSKLIREWVSQVSGWTVVFKNETVVVSGTTRQEVSGDRYLVIVDDAHLQSDIDALLQLVRGLRTDGQSIKVLLSCHPIDLPRVDASLRRNFDPTDVVQLTELRRLEDKDVRALAEEVLGPQCLSFAPYLVSVSRDTPLVTVIGGRCLRRDPGSFHHLPDPEEFRQIVFDKFSNDFETAANHSSREVRSLVHLSKAVKGAAFEKDASALREYAKEESTRMDMEVKQRTIPSKVRQQDAAAERLESEVRISQIKELQEGIRLSDYLKGMGARLVWNSEGQARVLMASEMPMLKETSKRARSTPFRRELRSAGRFDRKLASLFEALEGREKELQARLDEVVKGLLDGSITRAPEHHPTDDTCCLPLIGHFTIVFRPDKSVADGQDEAGRNITNFAGATLFDLLNIEEERD